MIIPAPDPFHRTVVYASSDAARRRAEEDETPLYAHQWQDLRDHCRAALAAREERYPDLIKRGEIAEGEALDDIRAWRLIAAEWNWIADGEGAPAPADTLTARRAAVELALERCSQAFAAGDRRHETYRAAHLNLALQWHLRRVERGVPEVVIWTRLNREFRERQRDAANANSHPQAKGRAA